MKRYFAYGSNMDKAQMARDDRAPDAIEIGKVQLSGHEFVLDRRGFASITKHENKTVWGVVYELSDADETKMDRREGVHLGLYRKESFPEIGCQLVYISNQARGDHPDEGRSGYMAQIVEAAKRWHFPESYITELQGWIKNKG